MSDEADSAHRMEARGWRLCLWQRTIGAFDLAVIDLGGGPPASRCGWTLETAGVQLNGTAPTPEEAATAARDMTPDRGDP